MIAKRKRGRKRPPPKLLLVGPSPVFLGFEVRLGMLGLALCSGPGYWLVSRRKLWAAFLAQLLFALCAGLVAWGNPFLMRPGGALTLEALGIGFCPLALPFLLIDRWRFPSGNPRLTVHCQHPALTTPCPGNQPARCLMYRSPMGVDCGNGKPGKVDLLDVRVKAQAGFFRNSRL